MFDYNVFMGVDCDQTLKYWLMGLRILPSDKAVV